MLIVCCDGLKGLPDAIEATWPQALVQTCVIHLLRASMRLCSRGRPKSHRSRASAGLHRGKRRSGREGVGRPRGTMGKSLSGCDTNMAPSLGRVHSVPAVPAGASQNRVHHQRRRECPLSTTESHQNQGAFPNRPISSQAATPRRQKHNQQTRRKPRHRHPRLENSPKPTRNPLP